KQQNARSRGGGLPMREVRNHQGLSLPRPGAHHTTGPIGSGSLARPSACCLTAGRILVMATHLRVFPSPKEDPELEFPASQVRVRLGDLLPLVALAHRHNYLWLKD